VVYVAEQEEPVRRRVALKIIKLGMDTKQVVARFEAERQALALMDHPNIAKVLDAGATDTGRPYFVMELVRGIRITDYCDKNNLPTEERLKLFIQVCLAIQHAHQKGIIHRDIKPSNILVTLHDGVPVPKVIDFGIAKATTDQRLTDKTIYTAFEQFIGTPAYMSPEQAEMSGLDIDTRSDIYSLGVLLYELLTGRTPFDAATLVKAGLGQMRRIIREQEPQRPSTRLKTLEDADLTVVAGNRGAEPPRLIHLIRGDLDWIVMKALEKDRTRRYETINGLSMDVKRHMENEPIIARPPSSLYRLQKLIQRKKVAVGATCAVILALIVGLMVTTWLLIKEKEARQRAVEAEKAQNQLLQETDLRKLSKERQDLEGQGKLADAELAYRKMLVIQTNLYGSTSSNLLQTFDGLAYLLQRERKYHEMEMVTRDALVIQRKLSAHDSLSLANFLHRLGDSLEFQREFAEAETLQREALAMQRKLLSNENPDIYWTVFSLTRVLQKQGKLVEIEAVQRDALPICRSAAEQGNTYAELQLGRMYSKGQGVPKDENEATKWYGKLVEQRRKDAESDGNWGLNNLAWLLATCEFAPVRDGSNAVIYAEKSVTQTSRKNPVKLDTLAAAYAETGQFEKTVSVQKEAMSLLKSEEAKKDYEFRLKLYESGLPYREVDRD
jgi:serine/threonine protein kinase